MNSFEEYTIIIGLLAVMFEAFSYLRVFLRKLLH
jgi:hypothetical protein